MLSLYVESALQSGLEIDEFFATNYLSSLQLTINFWRKLQNSELPGVSGQGL